MSDLCYLRNLEYVSAIFCDKIWLVKNNINIRLFRKFCQTLAAEQTDVFTPF